MTRLSQVIVQAVLLDEFDAPATTEPIVLSGDADGSAIDKARAFLDELEAKLKAEE